MSVTIIGMISLLIVMLLIAMTAGNMEEELKEQMTKEDEEYFVLKARNLHNLYHVLGSLILFLIPYLAKDFREEPDRSVVLIAFGLLVLGTVIYSIQKATVRIVYDHGQITRYSFNRVKAQGNINDIDIDECVNREHPYNTYENWLLYKDTVIVFQDGSCIEYQTSMKNAYKLEAILKKRGCFQYENIKKKKEEE